MATQLFRAVIDLLIDLYLLPFSLNKKLSLYIKGKILTHDEHYAAAIDVIRRKFPTHQGVVVDVGAFDGDSTIYLAKRLKHNEILGFEPNLVPYEIGATNVKSLKNVRMYNHGFSNHVGDVELYVTKNLVSSSLYDVKDFTEITSDHVIKVKVDTLDNFFSSYGEILLIKLDVQGAELDILQEGKETLKKTKLVLTEMSIVEMYHGACLYFEVDQFLRNNNFRIHTIITNYNKDGIKYFDILYIKNDSSL